MEKSAHKPIFSVKASSYTCQFQLLEPGLVFCERQHHWPESVKEEVDVLGPLWGFALFTEDQANLSFLQGKNEYPARKGMAVFVPPFEIFSTRIGAGDTHWLGFFSKLPVPSNVPRHPVLFYPPSLPQIAFCPGNSLDIFDFVWAHQSSWIPIQKKDTASPMALRAKRLIDKSFFDEITLQEVAQELGASLPVVDREFKKCFGLSPSAYRKKSRMIYAALSLVIDGAKVSEIGTDVGYSDLDNFTRQFKSVLRATPQQFKPPEDFVKPLSSR